jgi:serine/threonine protein kinase
MLESILKGLTALKEIGINYDNLKPGNIHIHESGELSLIDLHCYEPLNNTAYKQMVGNYNIQAPLSPQLMKPYITKKMDLTSYSPEKNDVWGLGITLISSATICNFREFYDYTYGNIDLERVNEKLEMMSKMGYSPYLIKCVANMVSTIEDHRPTFKDISNFISARPAQPSQSNQNGSNPLSSMQQTQPGRVSYSSQANGYTSIGQKPQYPGGSR